jgi:hypothetical protein
MDQAALHDLIEALDDDGRFDDEDEQVRAFLVESCALVADHLSPTSASALAVARQYLAGTATDDDMTAARVRCWRELDADPDRWDLTTPRVCAIRAVICAVSTEPTDPLELLWFFVPLLHQVADVGAAQADLLDRLFPSLDA